MNAWDWLQEVAQINPEAAQAIGARRTHHGAYGEGLAFPYRTLEGRTAAEMFVGPERVRAWGPGGAPGLLFGIDDVANEALREKPVILTQDPMDAMSCKEAGFVRSCATPGLFTVENEHPVVAAVLHGLESLRRAPCVIVAANADQQGDAFAHWVLTIMDPTPVRVVSYPAGAGSCSDVLCQFGAGVLAKAINDAELLEPPTGLITGFSNLPPRPKRRIMKAGLERIDNFLAFQAQSMSVCTGIPGMGKSTFVRFIAHHLTQNEGVRVGAMELEGDPDKMKDHLCRISTGRPFSELSGQQRLEVELSLDQSWSLAHRPKRLDGAEENLEWLHDRVRALATIERCKFIYVDPWNELEHLPQPGESLTNYINYATRCIRQWAERYDTHICMIAHPKKISGEDIPNGYDIADSAAWANKPSLGFSIHQEPDDPERGLPEHISLMTWKVRDVEGFGVSKGITELQFHPHLMTYEPLYPSRIMQQAAKSKR